MLSERELMPRGLTSEPSELILLDRQALHAHRLTIMHPITGVRMTFEAAVPADIIKALDALRRWRQP
jgi:23S rRNA pseudouridine1911/1915/1917 synthase